MRTASDLPGAFTAKTVKGRLYWYFQYTEPVGVRRQVFVWPEDSLAVQKLVAAAKVRPSGADSIGPLARSAVVLGCEEVPARQFKVLQRLGEYGFFRAGGILVGTHAFLAYGNILGVRWGARDAARTQDIDFAQAGRGSISRARPGAMRAPRCCTLGA